MFITYVYDFHEQIGLIKIGLINTTRIHYFANKKLNVFLGVWPRTPFSAQLVPRPTILRSPWQTDLDTGLQQPLPPPKKTPS